MCEFPPSAPPPESLTKDLVQHLSKEIETTTHNIMVFRTRIGFGLLVGPFLLLGSLIVGAKGQPVTTNLKSAWPALVVIIVCYLSIAYIASEIEAQAWEQCNKWREIIGDLCRNPPNQIDYTKLKSKPLWQVWILKREWPGVTIGYLVGYLLLFVAVIAAVFIVNAGTQAPANCSGCGATFRIEQVTPTPQVSGDENKQLPKK
jgi:hypothetical protein